MSHFTYVNYALDIALNDEGAVNVGDDGNLGIFDYGTFNKNRQYVYDRIIDNTINITLSGHSHRAALYQKEKVTDEWRFFKFRRMNDKLIVRSNPLQEQQYTQVDNNQARILISACGGPIAVQNYHGELLGCGLDYPSGSYIKPDKTGIYTARHPNARPRFAVALDFMDIVGKEKHKNKTGVFKSIHSSSEAPFEFTMQLNDTPCNIHKQNKRVLPAEDFIKAVRFYGYVFNHGVVKVLTAEANSEFISEYNYKMVINQDKLLSIMSAITHDAQEHPVALNLIIEKPMDGLRINQGVMDTVFRRYTSAKNSIIENVSSLIAWQSDPRVQPAGTGYLF